MRMPSENRVCAICAVGGPAFLLIGTFLHPMGADPNDPIAAFTEYAQDRFWVASHLVQLLGIGLIVVSLLFFVRQLEASGQANIGRVAAAGAVVSLALAAVLQAVDGIALKNMVDAWAAAPEAQKQDIFYAAFAVRQVEIGLASLFSLSLGLTIGLCGAAVIPDSDYPKWFGVLALAGGASTLVAGLVMAYAGFSELAMTIGMPANLLLVGWILSLAGLMWRRDTAA